VERKFQAFGPPPGDSVASPRATKVRRVQVLNSKLTAAGESLKVLLCDRGVDPASEPAIFSPNVQVTATGFLYS
jgi:hypothetical protein